MSNVQTIQAPVKIGSGKMLRAMVGIGIACALMIVLTYEGTLPLIEKNKAEALEKAIFKVLPGTVTKQTFKLDENNVFTKIEGEEKEASLVYAGYDDEGKLVGLALEASGMGFADVLKILYGYNPEKQQVIGFYVLESKETPGLGDKIEKDPVFLSNFDGLDVALNDDLSALKNTVASVKSGEKENAWEVDAITGATISSRAIGNIISESTSLWVPLLFQQRDIFENAVTAEEKVQ
ncbi:MAG: FMN-binding protein [Bacteroidota bacterium]